MSQSKIARTYYRGPGKVYLRCGTRNWGFRHLVARGRWNATFDKKVSRTVRSGTITSNRPGERIYEDLRLPCPPDSRTSYFKVVTNPVPLGADPSVNPQGIITAYRPAAPAPEPAARQGCPHGF
ncbi:hypothetical protein ACIP88_18225 [Streptomyces uncialis]|uniref:hypothetical protein n=1 Tax=Streptomyces uncialis TaxID=1048205 RepID=UPI0038243759